MWTTSTVDEILRDRDAVYLNTAFDARSRDIANEAQINIIFLQGGNSFHLTFFSREPSQQ